MPKFDPAPRIPQKRSAFSSGVALRNSPDAVTTSRRRSWSTDSPCLRMIQPIPPPRVSPATPVDVTMPAGAASENACVSLSSSPSRTPACTRAVRATGSTRTPFIGDRSMTNASSATLSPGKLCPPLRTATGTPCSRANRTAVITSATPAQRATRAGRRSMEPFQTFPDVVVGGVVPPDEEAPQVIPQLGHCSLAPASNLRRKPSWLRFPETRG